jgi:elongation factor Ts
MAASTEQIKKLRDMTGAGILDAKRTLEEHDGDFDKALAILKEKGLKSAAKKGDRAARQGVIETYVHSDDLAEGKIGVMLELNCETDFVARNEVFRNLAHDLALHIAASKPKYVSVEDIPASVVDEQKRIFADAAAAEGKPAPIIEKIVQGKIANFFQENCLLRQNFIRDDSMTVGDLIKATIAKTNENIVIRRFARFEIGEA